MTKRLDELLRRMGPPRGRGSKPLLTRVLERIEAPERVLTYYERFQPTLRVGDPAGEAFGALIRKAVDLIEDPDVANLMWERHMLALLHEPLPEETRDEQKTLMRYVEQGKLTHPFALRELLGLFHPSQIPGLPDDATDVELELSAEGLLWLATAVRESVYDDGGLVAKLSREGGARRVSAEVEERVRESFGLAPLKQIEDLTRRVRPVDRSTAEAFVRRYHRALPEVNPRGLVATAGLDWGGTLTGVVVVNRPSARGYAQRPEVIDISRIATDGRVYGASSALARWVIRHASELVDTDKAPLVITYSMLYEHGDTYKALQDEGMHAVELLWGKGAGGARPGGTAMKEEPKIRWEWGKEAGPNDPSLLRLSRAWRSFRETGRLEGLSGLNQERLDDLHKLVVGERPPRGLTAAKLRERLRAAVEGRAM